MTVSVHLIAAARPNFMKVAPLYHTLAASDWCKPIIVHTGQHYDPIMSDTFFNDLRLPAPHIHLGTGGNTHAQQTARVMLAYEETCLRERPDWVVVVGDVNSTVACALVAAKLGIPVAHLEAGLRSGDRTMPEELNRLVTDTLCDLLWTPSADGDSNLLREGIPPDRIECVGNIMIDSYEMLRPVIQSRNIPAALGITVGGYGVVTLHRPSNVDDREQLAGLVDHLAKAAASLPLVFPVHPRTRKQLSAFGLSERLTDAGIRLIDPLGYVDFMSLVSNAKLVVTDSGGVQEETTYLGIPCLTLRDNTERPVTITEGTNRLLKPHELEAEIANTLAGDTPRGRKPQLWDGQAAHRVAASLQRHAGRFYTKAR